MTATDIHLDTAELGATADRHLWGHFARQAMIGIKCTGDTTKIAEKLATIESVDYVVLTAGSFDAIVEVVCTDDDDLLDLLNTQIRALPGVISTETLVYLKLVKQQYNWGTR